VESRRILLESHGNNGARVNIRISRFHLPDWDDTLLQWLAQAEQEILTRRSEGSERAFCQERISIQIAEVKLCFFAGQRQTYLCIILLTSNINAMATADISTSSSDEFDSANSISRLVVEKLKGVHTVMTEIDDSSQSDSEETPSSHPISSPKQLSDFSVEAEYFRLSFDVLNVLEKYGTHVGLSDTTAPTGPVPWSGKLRFLPHVYHHISRSTPVQLTMPAFPCKSVSSIHRVQDTCLANRASAESQE
jgi:hypothetical protein